jgi:uncharacterized protein YgiB involved in biofilm formation
MSHTMQICGDIWLPFFAGWMLAAFCKKRSAERVASRRQMDCAVPVVSGFTLLLSSRLEI